MHQNLPLYAYMNALMTKNPETHSTYVRGTSNLAIIKEKLPISRTWDR